MSDLLIDLGIVFVFILIGGYFAAAELALVSLREAQIGRIKEQRPKAGRRLARLAKDPNRMLASVQVGVTLAGFLSAGFGASSITPRVSPLFVNIGLGPGLADTVAFVGVTIVIVYLSLILGELVPKRLALQRTEGVAVHTVAVVEWTARISRPFIWALSVSTDAVVRLLGGDPTVGRQHLTEEDLRGLVATHSALTDAERELIDDVFAAGDRELKEVMVPRTEVAFLDHDMPLGQAADLVRGMPHSRYPVYRDSTDDIIGFVHIRDIFDPALATQSVRVGSLTRVVARMPGSKRVIPALTEMRDAGHHLAIVEDEYGGTDGIVSMEDLVEELVGDIRDEYDRDADWLDAPRMPAQPWETDGLTNLDDFAEESGLTIADGPYETIAGYMVHRLGRLPVVGDSVATPYADFTVVELDGRRISRLRVTPREQAGDSEPATRSEPAHTPPQAGSAE